MKNLTYDQLVELAPKDRPFQIEVESNPLGKGGRQILWAHIDFDGDFNTNLLKQEDIYDVDYSHFNWKNLYTGTFTLIDPRYQKPEVLKVGQKVRIMESARESGLYEIWDKQFKDLIGTVDTITEVFDTAIGVYYCLQEMGRIAHYCVMPVEEEEIQEIPELGNTLEQLDNLVSKAQDIISKYKK